LFFPLNISCLGFYLVVCEPHQPAHTPDKM
jgi:hypothetical protein